jgi:isopentenyl phosphate kinase
MLKILKIGGSVLTDKSSEAACARIEEIDRISEEIASNPSGLILVHGAGSFGHIQAGAYGMPERFSRVGIRVIHSSVARLNRIVVDALAEAGANPVSVHPFSCTLLRDGRIERMDVDPLEEMVKRGLIPVLHGDVAMDTSRGAGIVSGDQLVPYLARVLNPGIVAEGFDKDGVIHEGAPLIEVTREMLPSIEKSLGGSSGTDVTGGMRTKVLELLDLADIGIPARIFNASRAGMVERALSGEAVGTLIRRSN